MREHALAADRRRRRAGARRLRPRRRGDARRDRGRDPRRARPVEAGIEDLVVMKTTRSAFSGFPRDRYTTLRRDRRPADGHEDHRDLALRRAATSTSTRPGPRSGRRSSRSSPTTTARASRPRSGSWPRRSSSGTRRSTRCGWCCRTCTTGRSTCRRSGIDERQARLRRHDRAARAHRGDGPPRRVG